MIGILVLTHGDLGRSFIRTAEMILGVQNHVGCVSFLIADDLDQKRREISNHLKKLNGGYGVVILTDLFGGSPTNLALSFFEKSVIEVVTGMNLPLLIYLLEARQKTHNLKDLAWSCERVGRKFLCQASGLLPEAQT